MRDSYDALDAARNGHRADGSLKEHTFLSTHITSATAEMRFATTTSSFHAHAIAAWLASTYYAIT